MFEKEHLKIVLKKNNVQFMELMKSIGLDVKKHYNHREIRLILSYMQKTEAHTPCFDTVISTLESKHKQSIVA